MNTYADDVASFIAQEMAPQNAPQIGNGPGFQNRPVSRQYDEQTKTT